MILTEEFIADARVYRFLTEADTLPAFDHKPWQNGNRYKIAIIQEVISKYYVVTCVIDNPKEEVIE